jgi:hypothetical protein
MVDGQIVEAWNSYDQLGLLRQIGALPGLGGRDRFLKSSLSGLSISAANSVRLLKALPRGA